MYYKYFHREMKPLGTKAFALVLMLISFAGGSSTVEAGPTLTPTLISLEATEKEPGIARVWAVDDGEKVKREELNHPLATSSDNPVWDGAKIAIFGARNEIVAFQLILESVAAGAEDIDVFITDLSRGSYSIPNSRAGASDPYDYRGVHIELFLEHYIKIVDPSRGGSAWSQAAKPSSDYLGWVPDALIPLSVDQELGGAPFDIPANSNQGIWVDMWIPRDTPEGLYTGEVQILSGNKISHKIPIEVSVLNFSLPDETHFPNMFALSPGEIAARHGVKVDLKCVDTIIDISPGSYIRIDMAMKDQEKGLAIKHFQLGFMEMCRLIMEASPPIGQKKAGGRVQTSGRLGFKTMLQTFI